jgi:hypothetical protein
MEQNDALRSDIIKLLQTKASVKQDIADYSLQVFDLFRQVAQEENTSMRSSVEDSRVRVRLEENGNNELIQYAGSDVLVFHLHENVFRLPDEHPLWEEDYLKNDPDNGYFGVIYIYNFLAESFEKNRAHDRGYLIARVFINRDHKCLVEGKGQLGELYKDVAQCELTKDAVQTIYQCAIIYAVGFDLVVPPYEMIQELSVMQIQQISSDLQTATGKRLGFKFSSEDDMIF